MQDWGIDFVVQIFNSGEGFKIKKINQCKVSLGGCVGRELFNVFLRWGVRYQCVNHMINQPRLLKSEKAFKHSYCAKQSQCKN